MSTLPPRPPLSKPMMSFGFILTPTRFLERCWETCGDYFTLIPQPGRNVVVTVDPAAVKQVFQGDPNLLHAGAGNAVLAPILGERSVLLLDGPEHLRQRRLLLPPFHGERMRLYGDVMEEAAQRAIGRWPRDRRFAVLPSMQAVTLEVILRAVFGVRDRARVEEMGRPLRKLLDMTTSRRQVLMLALSANRTGPRSPWAKFLASRHDADRLIHAEIRARRAQPDAEERDDVLSLLLSARDEEGNGLSDDELRDELITLLVAGHETTATALAWALERLARHPQMLARARSDDAYLEAVIKETLRLRPVVPAVARQLQAPMTFGPWDLPAGVNIAPSIYLLHRRPDLYPQPEAFRPERFLGDGGAGGPNTYEWIPFGGGIRRCLGASFALFEMRVVLKAILETVELQPQRTRSEATARRAITFAPVRGGRVAVSTASTSLS